ncbi:MAG TPA: hypothetical protein VGG28_08440 [Kofleriaceae bacterium]|jgi:hypothetical protein
MTTITTDELATICGGAQLDPNVPLRSRDHFVAKCGPQIDAYTAARTQAAATPLDTRKEIDAAAAGRSLAVCAMKNHFEPLPQWRFATQSRR